MSELCRVKVKIETLSPVVLTAENQSNVMTDSRDSFSGSVLRGVIAGKYIKEQKLKDAHKDPDFRPLFFKELRFVDAYPLAGEAAAYPVPLCVSRDKKGSQFSDFLLERGKPGFKAMKGMAHFRKDGSFTAVSVEKTITLHMSRSTEKERLMGRSFEGGIYNYEAIDAGQSFEGEIIGTGESLNLLLGRLGQEKSWKCRIGRAKWTGYGTCRITVFQEIKPLMEKGISSYEAVFRLQTPLLFNPVIQKNTVESLENVLGEKVHVEEIFGTPVSYDHFVGVWGMRAPRMYGFAAGSVFKIKKEGGWSGEDLVRIMYDGTGLDRVSGFGQFRLWEPKKAYTKKNADQKTSVLPETLTSSAKNIVKQILSRHLIDRVRLWAGEDASSAKLDGKKHALARLEDILGDRTEEPENRLKKLLSNVSEAAKTSKGFKENLKAMRISGTTIYSLLCETGDVEELKDNILAGGHDGKTLKDDLQDSMKPYESLLEKVNLSKEDLCADPAIHYEYCLAFFRHGRKQAAVQERSMDRGNQ